MPTTAPTTVTMKMAQSEGLLKTDLFCSRRAQKYSSVPGANKMAASRMYFKPPA